MLVQTLLLAGRGSLCLPTVFTAGFCMAKPLSVAAQRFVPDGFHSSLRALRTVPDCCSFRPSIGMVAAPLVQPPRCPLACLTWSTSEPLFLAKPDWSSSSLPPWSADNTFQSHHPSSQTFPRNCIHGQQWPGLGRF
jgi:hypothetical protein